MFRQDILQLQASGILTRLLDKLLGKPPGSPLPRVRIRQPLSLSQVTPAMLVAIIGFGGAFVAFIGEVVAARFRRTST